MVYDFPREFVLLAHFVSSDMTDRANDVLLKRLYCSTSHVFLIKCLFGVLKLFLQVVLFCVFYWDFGDQFGSPYLACKQRLLMVFLGLLRGAPNSCHGIMLHNIVL